MRAGWRFGIAALAAALIFGSAPAVAQDAAPATNTANPPAETVGPRELRDFSLPGTVTRPAPPPAEREPAPAPAATAPRPTTVAPPATRTPTRDRPAAAPVQSSPEPARSVTQTLPAAEPLSGPITEPAGEAVVQPQFQPAPAPVAPQALPSEPQQGSVIPWLLALLIVAAGAGLFFWRQRSQPGYAAASAGAPAFAPERPAHRPEPLQRAATPRPEPETRSAPAPRPAPAPTGGPSGIVTTRLRPWLEIEFTPGRCVVENDKATIQFDVAVVNSGSAPARDVLIEASMFTAGPAQDQEIGAFFANPVAKGDRIPAIPPLKRVALKSAVSLTREQLKQVEVSGRRIFVPLVGLNALYRWSGGEGQTSASYVVGRDVQGEKMAPLRLDLGPRIFRGLGARAHNVSVRN